MIVLGVASGAGWYLHHLSHLSQSPTSAAVEIKPPKVESAPVAETKWLPEGWEQMGNAEKIEFLKKEELGQAEALVAQFDRSDEALITLGNVYRKYGNSDQAIACWEKALAINPTRVDAYDGMAMVAMEKGQHDRAAQLWGKAISLQPQVRDYRSYRAQALSRAGEHEKATEILKEELHHYPTSSMAHYLLGQEYMLTRDFAGAKSCYEKAVEYSPNHTGAYYGLMTVCLRLNLADEARRAKVRFDQCKARDTLDTRNSIRSRNDFGGTEQTVVETYLVAEVLYRRAGDFDRARESLRRAEAINPNHPRLLTRKIEQYRSRGQLAEALILHETIAKSNPDDILNLFNMAGICVETKQYDRAQAILQSAITRAPEFDGAYRELARLYLNQGREFARARELAAEAVKLTPTAANYFVYSWACERSGDHSGAVAALKRSSELEPDNPLYQDKFRLATMNE